MNFMCKHRAFKKGITFLVLTAFLMDIFTTGIAGAASVPAVRIRSGSAWAGSPRYFQKLDVASFELPRELGFVKYRNEAPGSSKTIIHIQDAHCNYPVQKRISGIIDLLNDKYGLDVVNLEGGAGRYDLEMFSGIEDPFVKNFVTDYFAKVGMLTGSEVYAVHNPDDVTLWGVEKKHLYLANLKIYRDTVGLRKEINAKLQVVENIIRRLKEITYNSRLLGFENMIEQHRSGAIASVSHIELLFDMADNMGIAKEGYPHIDSLMAVQGQGESIDFEVASDEREALIKELKDDLSFNEVREMDAVLSAFQEEDVHQKGLYDYLIPKAIEIGVDRSEYSNLFQYAEYVSEYDPSDTIEVKAEIKALENRIKIELFETEDERKLDSISDKAAVLVNLSNLTLRSEDFKRFSEKRGSFNLSTYREFLEEKINKTGWDVNVLSDLEDIDNSLEKIEQYYTVSKDRERSFVKNLKFGKNGVALLVTGGFHTAGISKLLKEDVVSVVSIQPSCDKSEKHINNYHKILAGELDPVISVVSSDTSDLQVPSVASEIAEEVFGDDLVGGVKFLKDIAKMIGDEGLSVVVVRDDGVNQRIAMDEGHSPSLEYNVDEAEAEADSSNEVWMYADKIREKYGVDPDEKIARKSRKRPKTLNLIVQDGIEKLTKKLQAYVDTDPENIPQGAVIPDLHGRLENLENALEKLDEFEEHVVFLGDYMDRGKEGIALVRRLMEFQKEAEDATFLMGNHDLMFIMAMMGHEEALYAWLNNGGLQVLEEAKISPKLVKELIANLDKVQRPDAVETYMIEKKANREKIERLHKKIMANKDLMEIAKWMKENCDLYELLPTGGGYVHAQMPMNSRGDIQLLFRETDPNGNAVEYTGIAALAKLEEKMKLAFVRNDVESGALQFLFGGSTNRDECEEDQRLRDRRSPLWIREDTSMHDIKNAIRGNEAHILDQMGAAFMVGGHTPVKEDGAVMISLGGRIFFIDRSFGEAERNVLTNDAYGLKNMERVDKETILANEEAFQAMWEEGRQRAIALLQSLREQYNGITPGADLMGKLYDRDGNLVERIAVEMKDADTIVPINAFTGEKLYDKNDVLVEGISIQEFNPDELSSLRFDVINNLNLTAKALDISDAKEASLRDRVFMGALDVITKSHFMFLKDNAHGVVGITDTSGERPLIYINPAFAPNLEVLSAALFHEAGEIFLAANPELIPEGMTAHELLRGASKTERMADPDGYRKGIQDEIFAEINEALSYYVTVGQKDFFTEDEARFMAAVYMAKNGRMDELEKTIMRRNAIEEVLNADMVKAYMEAREEYDKAMAELNEYGNADPLQNSVLQKALYEMNRRIIPGVERGSSYIKSKYSAFNTLPGKRPVGMIDAIIRHPDREIRIIPAVSQYEIEKLEETIEAMRNSSYRDGAVVDLPDGIEVIVVGDLHGRMDNLKRILATNGNLAKIRTGKAILVLAGDAVHNDPDADLSDDEEAAILQEMTSSVRIIRFIQRLKRENPDNVFYLAGNHDFLSGWPVKGDVYQGLLFKAELSRRFGETYVNVYEEFVENSPVMARTEDGLNVLHGGPVKSAESLQDIRDIEVDDRMDMLDRENFNRLLYEAVWTAWGDRNHPYSEKDVDKHLSVTGGKILVTSHKKTGIPAGSFYTELIEGKNMRIYGAKNTTGYMSYKDGKWKMIYATTTAKTDDESTDDDAALLETVDRNSGGGAISFAGRLERIADILGNLSIKGELGRGSFGTAVHVQDPTGEDLALKIAGSPDTDDSSDSELKRKREVIKYTDVALGVLAGHLRGRVELDFLPEIIGSGIHEEEPYVLSRLVTGYDELNGGYISELGKMELVSIAKDISKIFTTLQAHGAIMFDAKMDNFAYRDGKVMQLDTGACRIDKKRLDTAVSREIGKMGVELESYTASEEEEYMKFRDRIVERLVSASPTDLTKEMASERMDEARKVRQVKELYGASTNVIRNVRSRVRPVVVFLQKPQEETSAHFSLVRQFERRLKEQYSTNNLKVVSYDGTAEDLNRVMGKVRDILDAPDARAVVYTSPDLEVDESITANDAFTVVKEECTYGDMIAMVGPHVAFALGIVNYKEGNPTPELVDSLAMLLRMMTSDKDTLEAMNAEGADAFIQKLISGIAMIKMKKIDFKELRHAIDAQEKLLTAA